MADPTSLNGLLQTEMELCEKSQREIALEENLKGILDEDIITDDNTVLVHDLRRALSKLSQDHWMLERRWWEIKSSFQTGPLTRGIDFWRSQPKWYIHHVLYEDCTKRGDAVKETAAAVLIVRTHRNENMQLVIAPWSAPVARKLGGLNSTLNKNCELITHSNLRSVV